MDKEMQELVRFNVTDAAIAAMGDKYLKLTIKGLDDKEGFKAVHDARIDVKGKRIEVEKTRKDLKAEALRFERLVDGEAKRIFALIAPIEDHLTAEEKKIQDEKDRIKAEAEAKERERIQARIYRLEDLGMVLSKGEYVLPYDIKKDNVASPESVVSVSDEIFERFVQDVITAVAAEKERLANIEAEKKAEAERLAAERKRLDEEKAEQTRIRMEQEAREAEIAQKRMEIEAKQKAFEDRMMAEKRAIEAAKQKEIDDRRRAEELEKAKVEAAERARIEAEEKAKRDAEEAERLRLAAIEEARIQEELKPDKEKLLALADMIRTIPIPTLKHKAAQNIAEAARVNLLMASKHITEAVAKMKGGK